MTKKELINNTKDYYINYATYEIAYFLEDLTAEEGDEIGYIKNDEIEKPIYTFIHE